MQICSVNKPLPDNLFIEESLIDGQGLFASKDIPENTDLGISHIEIEKDKMAPLEMIRTPLGGFINHNTTPNCKTFTEGRLISIITLTDIKAGDEITLKYTMYDPSR